MGIKSNPTLPGTSDFPGGRSKLNSDGSEVLDPRPLSLPIGFERPPSIQQMIQKLVIDPQIREQLLNADIESFDEADDFDVAEDDVPQTPHEDRFDPLHLLAREQEVNSGAVRGRSAEEIAAAKKVLSDHRAALAADKAAKTKAVVDPPKTGDGTHT